MKSGSFQFLVYAKIGAEFRLVANWSSRSPGMRATLNPGSSTTKNPAQSWRSRRGFQTKAVLDRQPPPASTDMIAASYACLQQGRRRSILPMLAGSLLCSQSRLDVSPRPPYLDVTLTAGNFLLLNRNLSTGNLLFVFALSARGLPRRNLK